MEFTFQGHEIKTCRSKSQRAVSLRHILQNLEKSLLEIINLCKQKNIKLIGIKFPLSGEFLVILGNKSYKADSILISQGIEVWDFKNTFSNIDNYFEDPDHVNPEGANVLIDSLSRRAGIKNLQLLHN